MNSCVGRSKTSHDVAPSRRPKARFLKRPISTASLASTRTGTEPSQKGCGAEATDTRCGCHPLRDIGIQPLCAWAAEESDRMGVETLWW